MPRTLVKTGVEITSHFTVYDSGGSPVTGLTTVDFTILLAKNGSNDATAVSITEVGGGRYIAQFTPATSGAWYLLIRHSVHNVRGWAESYDSTADGPLSVDQLLDKADQIEGTYTCRQALSLILADAAGDLVATDTSATIKAAGSATTRIASVVDDDGNRTNTLTPP